MKISDKKKKVIVTALVRGILNFFWSKFTESRERTEKEETGTKKGSE
jgi:uncharacterized membrane protein